MSSKIEIVLDKVDDICEKFEMEGLHSHPTYKQLKRLFAELKTTTAAPVVERQPSAWLDEESGALATDKLKPLLDGFDVPLFRAPPELAELQAELRTAKETLNRWHELNLQRENTVAELQATIARLTGVLRKYHDRADVCAYHAKDIADCLDKVKELNK